MDRHFLHQQHVVFPQNLLSGSVRRVEDTLRINMTLTDGNNGAQIWAERYDGAGADVLGLQDSVIASVVTALPVRMELEEIRQAELGGTDNPTAFDAYLKGLDQYRLRAPEGHVQAVEYLKEAVSIDPNYGRAHALLAAAYFELWDRRFWWSNLVSDFSEHRKIKQWSLEHVLEAKRNPTALAYVVAARHLAVDGKVTEMLAEAREALRLDGNDPDAYFTLSLAMLLNGNHKAALGTIEHAMSLDPYYAPSYLMVRGGVLFMLERYEDAEHFLRRARERDPTSQGILMFFIANQQMLGRPIEEELAAARLRGEVVHMYKWRWRFALEKDWDHLKGALLEAGVPETAF